MIDVRGFDNARAFAERHRHIRKHQLRERSGYRERYIADAGMGFLFGFLDRVDDRVVQTLLVQKTVLQKSVATGNTGTVNDDAAFI